MPKNPAIKKVLVIGSGPIVIGQAAEFDYAGTQACQSLREEGIEVVLINSNPATIMTDRHMADKIYVEPLTTDFVKRVIQKEHPDSVLPTLGGQTGLNLAMELADEGFLEEQNVRLLGTTPETIKKAEDREAFREMMLKLGEPIVPSAVTETVEDSLRVAAEIGYPVIVRPAYTLGGTGGGIAENEQQLVDIAKNGLRYSRVNQVLIEKCISGWKEIEYEVIRDGKGNVITVCSMENVDPVGVHTGDSIVVAPAQTLADKEYQMLRTSALNIITELGIEGGCNVQFALEPNSFEYAVIEVNPRVSRSSALASKATGYPIARVASKIAIGYGLDEIQNAVTGKTLACFEPTIDYCVVKFPKWPFDKFVYAKRTLGTQMKATGEVMSIADNFEAALMKSVRSAEINCMYIKLKKLDGLSTEQLREKVHECDDERLFVIAECIRRGVSLEEIHGATKIDLWFLHRIENLINMERALADGPLTREKYDRAKRYGFPDAVITELSGQQPPYRRRASFKTVDTCAAEFEAQTPYYYSTWDEECEVRRSDRKKVIVFGSGPIRIGQGIEFDYCSVHCVWSAKEMGYEAIIVNNNPETVSTDFDTSDKLYFEPLTPEDVRAIVEAERPDGAIVQFGGQTAIKLAAHLEGMGVPILGTSAEDIDAAEDRERFDKILSDCGIERPAGGTVFTTEEAVAMANELKYPVLVRPSYVLGGQGMAIAFSDSDIREYMEVINRVKQDHPILVDKYLMGKEIEVDAICDGEEILIPGIMEHIERAGVHSGDSISVYPTQTVAQKHKDIIVDYTRRLARALNVVGMVNIQFVIYNDEVFVIEVNPRSSRTVPYISKVTGVPMVDLATRCVLGQKLSDFEYGTGLYRESEYIAVKVPVFSFEKLHNVDTMLGPEMKSTGEVLGLAKTFKEALYKALLAAGFKIAKNAGGVLITVRDQDKQEMIPIADKLAHMGFELYATGRTANVFNYNMIATNAVRGADEPEPNIMTLLESGKIDYVISTSAHGRVPTRNSVQIRRKAVERSIPCLTSVDTAAALVSSLKANLDVENIEIVDITEL
ncbi:carbamoyl-phosphate synthase large subunit [Feifania hominis]|uniref:Carbamoyl phosphate synthase large chain n=1 Tax=Feifania hominis TaxID=2763660 RepID=A0A926HSS2_9FIRM|nr:carbamoyl-phosphate synthase large subunit [Feifania hominis]MBC8535114.1 carbamoyl-phosphate synthase large subunit [Feifania hominis]